MSRNIIFAKMLCPSVQCFPVKTFLITSERLENKDRLFENNTAVKTNA
jgi:hypothetical protein